MKKITILFTTLLMALGIHAGELTVADGTATSENLPVYSYYGDVAGVHTQMIYPASYLEELQGTTISSMTFYVTTKAGKQMKTTYTVSVAIVEEDHFASSAYHTATLTPVYEGTLDASQDLVVVEFSEPFEYSEGNLLLDVVTKEKANYDHAYFAGITAANNVSIRHTTYGGVADSFLPKTTFEYEGGSATTCPRPSKLTSAATPDGAVLSWQGEEHTQYQVCVVAKDEAPAAWKLLDADVFSYTATGLNAGTTYDFYVRTYCSESEQSTEAKLSFIPVCNAPTGVEISNLTHDAATLTWDAVAGIDKYQFVCLRTDSTPNWEGVEPKEGLTVTVDTLQASTSYNFYVRSWFNAETQSDATKLSFTTNCVALELPFAEHFASTSLPDCWAATYWGSSYNYWSVDTYTDHTGGESYSLRYNARTSSSSKITTASIELAEDALLDFYYQNRYGSSGSAVKFDIIVLDASNEAELLSESVTTASPNNEWAQKTIDLSAITGKTIKVKFVGKGNGGTSSAYLRLDDITITEKPCVKPINLKAAASTTGAVITWNAGGSEASWNLRHKAVSAEEWTEVNALDEPTYTLSGCAAGTEYEVQVQAACNGAKKSEWTNSVKFTPVCPVPTKLTVSLVEENSAVATWECTEDNFNLQYKAEDEAEWTTVKNIAEKRHELTELKASTTYQVRVQTTCGSDYTKTVSFTTKCAPLADAIPYVLHMDSVAVGSWPECWFMLPSSAVAEVALMNDDSHRLMIAGEQECWVVLPAIENEWNGLTVSVTWSGMSLTEIGYLTAADEETFVALTALSGSPTSCDLRNAPEEAKYIAIHYQGTSDYSIGYIAEVRIETSSQTAVDNTLAPSNAVKRIENGEFIIEHNGVRYNVLGTTIK